MKFPGDGRREASPWLDDILIFIDYIQYHGENVNTNREMPQYIEPSVKSVSEQELLESAGPAQAYSGNFPFGF
jgi:hypothetical protein